MHDWHLDQQQKQAEAVCCFSFPTKSEQSVDWILPLCQKIHKSDPDSLGTDM